MRKLVVKLMYVLWALKRINRPHLGDVVVNSGKTYTLIQGVQSPYWDMIQHTHIGNIRINNVHKSTFKLKHPIKGRIERIKQSYEFQMRNWFSIDTYHKPLFKRISYRGN